MLHAHAHAHAHPALTTTLSPSCHHRVQINLDDSLDKLAALRREAEHFEARRNAARAAVAKLKADIEAAPVNAPQQV